MSDDRDTDQETDPPHREAGEDRTDPVPLEVDDTPLADERQPGAAPNDMPTG